MGPLTRALRVTQNRGRGGPAPLRALASLCGAVLLLLLAAVSAGASGSAGTPGPPPTGIVAPDDPVDHGFVRSPGAVRLLGPLERRLGDSSSTAGAPGYAADPGRAEFSPKPAIGSLIRATTDVFTPTCERLPYHSTAPPQTVQR